MPNRENHLNTVEKLKMVIIILILIIIYIYKKLKMIYFVTKSCLNVCEVVVKFFFNNAS